MVIIAINDNGKIDDDIDDQPTFRGDHDGQLAGGVHPLQGGRQCQCPHTEQNQLFNREDDDKHHGDSVDD